MTRIDWAVWTPGPERTLHQRDRWAALEAVVWHFTGGPKDPTGWLRHDACTVSWHLSVLPDGTVRQHYDLEARCSHAGGKTSTLRGGYNVNGRTIGVECVNVGKLTAQGGKHYWTGPDGKLKQYEGGPAEVYDNGDGTRWARYPRAQQEAIVRLGLDLAQILPVLRDPGAHVGHQDCDPTRKVDPGPAFPWSALRTNLLGAQWK